MQRTVKLNPVEATRLMVKHNHTMNCAKIGKHRRGTLLLEVMHYDYDSQTLTYKLKPNVGYVTKIYDARTKQTYRFCKRGITDFRWLLRKTHK